MKILNSTDIFDILKANGDILKKFRVRRIGLFGSLSQNKATEESDIDLIVDFEEKSFDNFMDLSFALEAIFNRKVDLLTDKAISPYILAHIKDEIEWYEA
jgi:predicted nucleotidyltransferase